MNSKRFILFKHVSPFNLLVLTIVMTIGCGHKMIGTITSIKPTNKIVPISQPVIPKRDTIKRKTLTESEKQAIIEKYYRYNYDKYFLPDFNSLRSILMEQSITIKNQAQSVKELSETISKMRLRYMRRTDSMQQIDNRKDTTILSLQRKATLAGQKSVLQGEKQLSDLNQITNLLLIAWGTLFLGFLGLAIFVYFQSKRITRIYQSVSHE